MRFWDEPASGVAVDSLGPAWTPRGHMISGGATRAVGANRDASGVVDAVALPGIAATMRTRPDASIAMRPRRRAAEKRIGLPLGESCGTDLTTRREPQSH